MRTLKGDLNMTKWSLLSKIIIDIENGKIPPEEEKEFLIRQLAGALEEVDMYNKLLKTIKKMEAQQYDK